MATTSPLKAVAELSLAELCYPSPLPPWAIPPAGVHAVDNWKPNKLFAALPSDCRRWTNDDRSTLVCPVPIESTLGLSQSSNPQTTT